MVRTCCAEWWSLLPPSDRVGYAQRGGLPSCLVEVNVSYVLIRRPWAHVLTVVIIVAQTALRSPTVDSGFKPEMGFMLKTVPEIDTGGERRWWKSP